MTKNNCPVAPVLHYSSAGRRINVESIKTQKNWRNIYSVWPNFRILKMIISGHYDEPNDSKALQNNTYTCAHCNTVILSILNVLLYKIHRLHLFLHRTINWYSKLLLKETFH